jgi:serine/threonine protein kinase
MEQEWKHLLRDFDLWPLEGISEYNVPVPNLPFQRADGKIVSRQGQTRSTLDYKENINVSINSIIQKANRTTPNGQKATIVVKRPRTPHENLRLEAVVQALAHSALIAQGAQGAVAKVYDVFVFANEVRFAMEWIDGQSCYEFLADTLEAPAKFQTYFLHVLLQTAYILDTLGQSLYIDHRDMKLDNLWIRKPAGGVTYTILINGKETTYRCPFQVVILDFGFACLGTDRRLQVLNLGQTIPDIDPCPKEGRDLYHIVNRLLDPPKFSDTLHPAIRDALLQRLQPTGPSYHALSHVLTSIPTFSLPSLKPRAILAWALTQV